MLDRCSAARVPLAGFECFAHLAGFERDCKSGLELPTGDAGCWVRPMRVGVEGSDGWMADDAEMAGDAETADDAELEVHVVPRL